MERLLQPMSEKTINSPLPGTFYRRASPEDDFYVKEGDRVRPGDIVGLVEVMKMYQEIAAEEEGTVERFLVESGDPVDAGQPIISLSA
jgi:acetyl-CoA carboxylase biotin carboxyl carrier protein